LKEDNYYNIILNRDFDISKDVCSFSEWNNDNKNNYLCAKHENGFYVFSKPEEISKSDEYEKTDPYQMKEYDSVQEIDDYRVKTTIDICKRIMISSEKIKILDIGCGKGIITNLIRQVYPNSEITGLDYSLSAINYASKKFPSIDFIVSDANILPFKTNTFDLVIMNNIFEHIVSPISVILNVNKVLKKNGYLIISTPNRYRLSSLLSCLTGNKVNLISLNHITEYSIGQIVEILKYTGFKLNEIKTVKLKQEKLKHRFIYALINIYLKIIKSHNRLDDTVFYTAQKP